MKRILLSVAPLFLAFPVFSAAQVNSSASFALTSTVVNANPPNVGFNVANSGVPNIADNNWVQDGGMASYDLRFNFSATNDGATNGTTFICTDVNNSGDDFYASLSNGLFIGGQARVYRFNSTLRSWSLIRTSVVSGFTANSSLPSSLRAHTITLGDSGAQIKAGDAIWISCDNDYNSPEAKNFINFLDPRLQSYGYWAAPWSCEGENAFKLNDTNPCTYVHDTDVPIGSTNGGSSSPPLSLRIEDSTTQTGGIWQYMQLGNCPFEANHTYSFSVWLKQSGISDGNVTVSVQGTTHIFSGVTSSWAKYTWSNVPVVPNDEQVSTIRVDYNAPGTLWVTQVVLADNSHPPFSLDPRVLSLWQSFRPGTIRFWSCQGNSSSNYSFWSLDSWLSDESIGRNDFGIGNIYAKNSISEHLPTALSIAKQVGNVDPWFIVNPSFSEQEWSNLVDYLASPAGSTPYAMRRPTNHPGPYTADFGTIFLEFGNEEWGTQQTATTFPDPQYGAFGHYMVSQAIAGKSYFDKTKIKFIANAFTVASGNTTQVMQEFPEASLADYFSYSGGDKTLSGDAYFENELLSVPEGNASSNGSGGSGGVGTFLAQAASQRVADAANGIPYQIGVYEGGPGADLPGSTTTGDDTLAAATAALDQVLACAQNGFGPQNFFLFNPGTGPFTSHTIFANGLVPHPVWTALQMRNQFGVGNMVSVVQNSAPTDAKGSPLVACYAFLNGSSYSVFFISRDLNNSTPVSVKIPFLTLGTATVATLTGNPRFDNNTVVNIKESMSTVSGLRQTYSFSLPPGSIYILNVPTTGRPYSFGQVGAFPVHG
jgi:hypothetical protein